MWHEVQAPKLEGVDSKNPLATWRIPSGAIAAESAAVSGLKLQVKWVVP